MIAKGTMSLWGETPPALAGWCKPWPQWKRRRKRKAGKREPPCYKPVRKYPYIPTEEEINQLIAASGKKLATFLQLLKETGMRCGEAANLKWADIDFARKCVKITPEKGSDPRILPISEYVLEKDGLLFFRKRK